MSESNQDERKIFLESLKYKSPEEREAFLQQACSDDSELLSRVRALLATHDESQGPLDSPPTEAAESPTLEHSIAEKPGDHIGPFKLLQELGRGGMGVVYQAEQSKPVARRVALKIIKPGMDTGQVIARFEAERQALAMMDHPNIAKVLDAGTTESGRPYFVMELVQGIPITQFCDEHRYSPRQRLELFIQVCQAVQHAHLKGIIHRDVKPSNVLVAEYGQQATPKVIDFGVAKATSAGNKLTDKTVFTQFGQIMGTLEYMSPEQAKLNQLDVDTRSDVYSLGVLLYELLTGDTPLDRKRLHSAALDEMLRIIREEEPLKPSTRLSSANDRAAVARYRAETPDRLDKVVKGDLDWIAMKALEKDRSRRYETANSLADDIDRFLKDEPIEARPPSRGYLAQKFVRRNKGPVIAASLLLASLIAGIVGTTVNWQAAKEAAMRANKNELTARQNEERAKEEANRANAAEQLARGEAERAKAAESKASEANQQALNIFVQDAIAFATSGDVTRTENLIKQIREIGGSDSQILRLQAMLATTINALEGPKLLQQAFDSDPDNYQANLMVFFNRVNYGDFVRAIEIFQRLPELHPSLEPHEQLEYGALVGFYDPESAEEIFQRERKKYDSGFGRILYGGMLIHRALFADDLEIAERAIDEARAAQLLLGNPFRAKHLRMVANDTAWYLAKKHGKPADQYIAAANEAASEIDLDDTAQQVQQPYVLSQIATHYDFVANDKDRAKQVYTHLARQQKIGLWRGFHASFVLKDESVERGLAILRTESDLDPSVGYMTAVLLAMSGRNPEESIAVLKQIEASDSHFFVWPEVAVIYLMLDERESAERLARRFGEAPPIPIRSGHNLPNRVISDFVLGKMSADQLIGAADNPQRECHAHFLVALLAFRDRDRARIHSHFRQAAEVCWPFYTAWHQNWSTAIVEWMERDPEWPVLWEKH